MAAIENILVDFTDYELAIFFTYRLKNYLTDTQEKIKDYIYKDRGLTDESIKYFLSKMPEATGQAKFIKCPRCKSSKLQKDSSNEGQTDLTPEYKDDPTQTSTLQELKENELKKYSKVTCIVCGLVLHDKYDDEKISSKNFIKETYKLPKIGPVLRILRMIGGIFKSW